MTNLLETTRKTAQRALHALAAPARVLLSGGEPGEAHLAGAAAAGGHGSTLDEDLQSLLLEIQRRRGLA